MRSDKMKRSLRDTLEAGQSGQAEGEGPCVPPFSKRRSVKDPAGLVREACREKKTNPCVVGVAQRAHSRRREGLAER